MAGKLLEIIPITPCVWVHAHKDVCVHVCLCLVERLSRNGLETGVCERDGEGGWVGAERMYPREAGVRDMGMLGKMLPA